MAGDRSAFVRWPQRPGEERQRAGSHPIGTGASQPRRAAKAGLGPILVELERPLEVSRDAQLALPRLDLGARPIAPLAVRMMFLDEPLLSLFDRKSGASGLQPKP